MFKKKPKFFLVYVILQQIGGLPCRENLKRHRLKQYISIRQISLMNHAKPLAPNMG